LNYRAEVDGLRAIAVIPVILFHAGFPLFSGGFIGVDIFFVISGYLITTIIRSDLESGKFSILDFYERRARRILPALFFVMFVCSVLSWFILAPRELVDFGESLVSVVAFVSNMFFWSKAGYFDLASELKPLLHTWSLAVEEQYYLFFPVFLIVAWRVSKKSIVWLLILMLGLSFFTAQWGSLNKPGATFYWLPTRAWELLVGSLTAFYLSKKDRCFLPKFLSEVMGGVGLSFIFYSIFKFTGDTPFPGVYALLPTLGAAMLIIFSTSETLVGKFLGNKIFVFLGLISYSAYLWHQPILAFARYGAAEEPRATILLAIILATFVCAYLSWRYIEVPFRNRNNINRSGVFLFGAGGGAFLVSIGLLIVVNSGFPGRAAVPEEVKESFASNSPRKDCDVDRDLKGKDVDFCKVGDLSAVPTIAVFGDSHSETMLSPFDSIAKELHLGVVHLGLGGCPPLLGVDVLNGNFAYGVCADIAKRQIKYVKENNIKKVFLVSRWTLYTDGSYKGSGVFFLGSNKTGARTRKDSREKFARSIEKTVSEYRKLGVEVFIVEQAPQQKVNPVIATYRYYSGGRSNDLDTFFLASSVRREEHFRLQGFTRFVFSKLDGLAGVSVVNLDSALCNNEVCYLGGNSKSYYEDDNHLSSVGAMMTKDIIKGFIVN
jgi:peptidoglycan/LPS O-acetylase OafA/YrhL